MVLYVFYTKSITRKGINIFLDSKKYIGFIEVENNVHCQNIGKQVF